MWALRSNNYPPFVKEEHTGGGSKCNNKNSLYVKLCKMKIYNDYYYEDERLYSTGNDELDDLLERAFCDGYEYAQREFGYVNPTQAKQFFTKVSKGTGRNRLSSAAVKKAGGSKHSMVPMDKNPDAILGRVGINLRTLKPTLTGDLHKSITTRTPNSYLKLQRDSIF